MQLLNNHADEPSRSDSRMKCTPVDYYPDWIRYFQVHARTGNANVYGERYVKFNIGLSDSALWPGLRDVESVFLVYRRLP